MALAAEQHLRRQHPVAGCLRQPGPAVGADADDRDPRLTRPTAASRPPPPGVTRVDEAPTSSRHFMSIEPASSPASVVTSSDSSARPTSRPTTTTVSGERCSSNSFWAATTWSRRERDAGL